SNHIDQLKKTLRIIGYPDEELMNKIESQSARDFLQNLDKVPNEPLERVVPTAPPAALNMMKKLLVLDPDRRYTAERGLEDPFVAFYHDPREEPTRDHLDFAYERNDTSLLEWKGKFTFTLDYSLQA
ncbi:Mitogen-activated protein kinase 13, partial [Cichlidogyrus casuarinus]